MWPPPDSPRLTPQGVARIGRYFVLKCLSGRYFASRGLNQTNLVVAGKFALGPFHDNSIAIRSSFVMRTKLSIDGDSWARASKESLLKTFERNETEGAGF
jgi:hypothetical protein